MTYHWTVQAVADNMIKLCLEGAEAWSALAEKTIFPGAPSRMRGYAEEDICQAIGWASR